MSHFRSTCRFDLDWSRLRWVPVGLQRFHRATLTTTTTNACGLANKFLDRYRVFPPTAEILDQIQRERRQVLQQIDPCIYQQVYQEIWQAQKQNVSLDTLWAVGPSGQHVYRWIKTQTQTRRTNTNQEHVDHGERLYQRKPRDDNANANIDTLLTIPEGSSLPASPSLSTDERFIAYIIPTADKDRNIVVMVDTRTHQQSVWQDLPKHILQIEIGGKANQRQGQEGYQVFLLTTDPHDGRPHQIWQALWSPTTRSPTTRPKIIWSVAHNPKIYLHVYRSKGGKYVVLHGQSLRNNQLFLLGPNPSATWHTVLPTKYGQTHFVDVGAEEEVFVLVRDDKKGHCLVETSISRLPLEQDPFEMDGFSVAGFEITEVDIYRYWLVLYEVSNFDGNPRIRIVDRKKMEQDHIVKVPVTVDAQTFQPVHNAWYDATWCRFQVDTPVYPSVVYEYNFVSRLLKQVTESYPKTPEFLHAERIAVSSWDGACVPLTVIRKTGQTTKNTEIQAILTAYGAYGQTADFSYNPAWQPLLNRGYVIAFAHIRGGGELGQTWYAQGRSIYKTNSVKDYLACARALRQHLQSSPVRLIAKAFSAGGVAVASAVNREPELFDDVVLTNAFLDVHATMSNAELALTEHEWDEYGNPLEDQTIAALIRSYCPVQTAEGVKKVPRTLLISTLADEAVPYWNTMTYAEALRKNTEEGSGKVCVFVEGDVNHDLGAKLLHISCVEISFILSGHANS